MSGPHSFGLYGSDKKKRGVWDLAENVGQLKATHGRFYQLFVKHGVTKSKLGAQANAGEPMQFWRRQPGQQSDRGPRDTSAAGSHQRGGSADRRPYRFSGEERFRRQARSGAR